jgi:hypothetical protein
LEKPRIVAHHIIWREILLQLLSHSVDEGDEHKWAIPSAISAEQHKEITVRQILHSHGLFPSDEALESKILEFFAQRTAAALSYASHFTDDKDPSFLALEPDSHADLLARLRFSTYTLTENKIRPLADLELKTTVFAFLDLRPDGTPSIRRVNAWQFLNLPEPWIPRRAGRKRKDAEKRSRYAPVLEFFNSLRERQGWSMIQFNIMVGVRGSISNVDCTEPLSFMSTLKALGIKSQINLEKIRKVVAKCIFEAHDLMLRSYYAVKFSSSYQFDFSCLVGSSFALQHCIWLLV